MDVIQTASTTPFNSKDTDVVAERVSKQFSSGKLLNILEDEDDPYSFGLLNARSEDVIDENKLDKVVHGAIDDILLHPLEETQGQTSGDAIVFETPQIPLVYMVGKQVKLLHPMRDVVVAIATIRKGLGADNIMHNRQQPEGFYVVAIYEIMDGNAPLMIPNMDDDPPQQVIEDAKGTTTSWRWDRICAMDAM